MSADGFFDRYPIFLGPNVKGALRNRLNRRYEALIKPNVDAIRGRRVLDLASHDGRWTFAALRAGAAHVTGIEARTSLVEVTRETMEEYEIPADRYRILQGDIHQLLCEFGEESFDTVFCFGFFYHTAQHMNLLSSIAQLQPDDIIIDTAIDPDRRAVIVLSEEDTTRHGNAAFGVKCEAEDRVIVGTPSIAALEVMLRHVGYDPAQYFDWESVTFADLSKELHEYRDGRRVSLRARRT